MLNNITGAVIPYGATTTLAQGYANMVLYHAAFNALVDNVNIFRGDTTANRYFADHYADEFESDGRHPNATETETFGTLRAIAFVNNILKIGGGGAGGVLGHATFLGIEMYPIKQNQTSQPLVFLLVSSTDHITGATGLSPTVALSKNGSAFAAPAGAVSEIGNGWYKVAGNATDSNTLGPLLLHATATGPIQQTLGTTSSHSIRKPRRIWA